MIFSREGAWKKKVDDFGFIAGMFRNLTDEESFSFQLVNDTGEEIRCKGSVEQLILEISQLENGELRAYRLGVSKEDRSVIEFSFLDEKLSIPRNELLMLDDAEICFEAFFAGRALPNAFNWRGVKSF